MANYAAPGNNPKNGIMVMTQASPKEHMDPLSGSAPNSFGKFLRGNPSALGTIQIMIGIFSFLMAVVLSIGFITFSTYSGVIYWGPVLYIISGSLTVAAGRRPTSCLVRGALGMSVWSSMAAAAAIFLFSLDFINVPAYDSCGSSSTDCDIYYQFLIKTHGISGVLLLLSVLQLIISICISAFGCRATCYRNPEIPVMTVAQNLPMTDPYGGQQPFKTHGGQQPFQTHDCQQPFQTHGYQQPFQTHGGQQPFQTHGGHQPFQAHGGQQGPFHIANHNAGSPLGYGHGPVKSCHACGQHPSNFRSFP